LTYGLWQMPMRFEQTPSGGSCYPGCHRRLAYDREHPVAPTTAPTTRESAALPRAQYDDERLVTWTAIDRGGTQLEIPDGSPASILLLVGDNIDAKPTMQFIDDLLSKRSSIQVVIFTCGEHADETADAMSTSAQRWPIIPDKTSSAAGALDVRGWPTVVILKSDGREVTRLSADIETLSLKLLPYIDLAIGAINEDQAAQRSTTQSAAEDPAKVSRRSLRTARVLLQQHKPEDALRALDDALKSAAESSDLKAARAEALLRLNRLDESLAVLDTLPVGALSPTANALLRAEIAIAQEHWDQARNLLEPALAIDPENPRLHRLMGKVCEQAGDWVQSAKHYRAATNE
jgi:predicted negative regulator of RcsB-dependent stress response